MDISFEKVTDCPVKLEAIVNAKVADILAEDEGIEVKWHFILSFSTAR